MVKDVKIVFGKAHGSEPVLNDADGHAPMWKKKSIFWELPYWQVLEVRNAIDVMHLTKVSVVGCEKNVKAMTILMSNCICWLGSYRAKGTR